MQCIKTKWHTRKNNIIIQYPNVIIYYFLKIVKLSVKNEKYQKYSCNCNKSIFTDILAVLHTFESNFFHRAVCFFKCLLLR